MTILITGGAGYIGSHCCVTFLEAGHEVVVVDNLSSSDPESLERVSQITGKRVLLEEADVRDSAAMQAVIERHACTGVIHFAGAKVVQESLTDPLFYYENNVLGALSLLRAMQASGVRNLIFSSSASVYGPPDILPVPEDHPTRPVSPYGRTKAMVEQILTDVAASAPEWRIGLLRYFNPVGAHESGLIGEAVTGTPTNLMPLVAAVAAGKKDHLTIYGNDYDTPDGTGVRDYIHVMDLVEGHLKAYEALLDTGPENNCITANLGTGNGYSVLDMIKAFERASNRQVPHVFAARRDGDIGASYADPGHARDMFGWSASKDLATMCRDTWNWVCKNPDRL